MPSRGEPVIPFSPLKLLKVDVETDFNGVSMVMEFIDNNGAKLITPRMPYPSDYDPMRVNNAECRGDEIRIKNSDGDLLTTVYADKIEYDNPIGTTLDPNGNMCINPEEGEENLPIRRFSARQEDASRVGWGTALSTAFGQANRAQQDLDNVMQQEANAREAQRPTLGASAWFTEVADMTGTGSALNLRFGYPMTDRTTVYDLGEPTPPTPKIKIDFDMKCTCCDGKIHYPDKLISLLGEDGAIKYFKFCKKTGSEPQLFCCECFGIMKNNSHIISAVNKMNQKIKDLMDLSEREEAVEKREKELDEQLKDSPKTKHGLWNRLTKK